MRKATVIVLSIAFVALCMYSRAKAESLGPPPVRSHVTINQPMIQCDSFDQLNDIATAKLKSDEAAQAKFDEYAKVMDAQHEPTCVFGRALAAVTIAESIAFPDLKFGDIVVNAYALHLDTPQGSWWGMYIVPKTPDTSI